MLRNEINTEQKNVKRNITLKITSLILYGSETSVNA